MNEFWIKVIVNIVVGFIVLFGFLWFWGKSSGVFNEGGIIYEALKRRRENNQKISKKRKNKKRK